MCIIDKFVECTCPLQEKDDDDVKELKRSPADCFGYVHKCCCCIPLGVAVIFICIVSFIWATIELAQSGKMMARIFPNDDDVFKYAKVMHIFTTTCFLVSCGVLMLGIIAHRFLPIHVYVWAAFIFNCICIVLDITATAVQVVSTGTISRRTALQLTFGVFWHSIFFYFISVVNSYKFRFWVKV